MIHIGLVGSGGMGNMHYLCYEHIKEAKVTCLIGISEQDRKKANEWNIPIYETITEACFNESLDVIDICTPTFTHFDLVKEALNNYKNVICEKPLTFKALDAQILFQLAKEKNRFIYVAHVVQFMKETNFLRNLVETKQFGEVLDGYFERLSEVPRWSNGWMFDKEKGGFIPYDLHIHDLDMIVSIFGSPEDFDFNLVSGNDKYPEHGRFMYHYPKYNIVAEASWFNAQIPFTVRWRVYFETAYVVYNGTTITIYPDKGDIKEYNLTEEIDVDSGINITSIGMYLDELREFVMCVQEQKETTYITESQVISVLEILEKINEETK